MRAQSQDYDDQELQDSGILGRSQEYYLLHRALLWKVRLLPEEMELLCEQAEDSMMETQK